MDGSGIEEKSGSAADAIGTSVNAATDTADNDLQKKEPAKGGGIAADVGAKPQAEEISVDAGQNAGNRASGLLSMSEIESAIDELDEDIENAFGRAADSIWSLASSVSSAVREHQPGLDSLRKNVSSRLAPLGSQIGSMAPKEEALASITGSVRSVAETVQRNAAAVEEAILSKANAVGTADETKKGQDGDGDTVTAREVAATVENHESMIPFISEGVDVGKGLAQVGDTLSNSIVGQTVGGLWDGLWGGGGEEDGDYDDDRGVDDVPRTRFEQRLFELQANPDTYCKPASDEEGFKKWGEGFNLDDYAKGCVEILHKHDAIAELYIKVVPSMVEEDTFWMRYFFAKSVLEKEEDRRRKLLESAETAVASGTVEEDGWGDDDWGDVDEEEGEKKTEKLPDSGNGQSSVGADAKDPTSSAAGGAADAGKLKVAGNKTDTDTALSKSEIPLAASESKDTGGGWSDDDWE